MPDVSVEKKKAQVSILLVEKNNYTFDEASEVIDYWSDEEHIPWSDLDQTAESLFVLLTDAIANDE